MYSEQEEPTGKPAAEIIDIEKQPVVREEIQVTKTPDEEPLGTTTLQPEEVQDQKQGQSFESREVSSFFPAPPATKTRSCTFRTQRRCRPTWHAIRSNKLQ